MRARPRVSPTGSSGSDHSPQDDLPYSTYWTAPVNDPRIDVRRLTRRFPGGAGLAPTDLHVAAGEIHAIVGLNGAGKTTLMRLILGMLRPDAGSITINGRQLGASDAPWGQVGHLLDAPLAYPELDCRANLTVAARLHGVPQADIPAKVDNAITALNLGQFEQTLTRRLSAGNRQRLGLAAALVHDPDVIILDEPTNALDPRGVILLRQLLLTRAEHGAGVLVSSHHLDEVARIANRITVINCGRSIGSLSPDAIDLERTFFAMVHDDRDDQ